MRETAIMDANDLNIMEFFSNCEKNYEYHSGQFIGENRVLYHYTKNGISVKPNLHGGYLPAAVFVPAYGRLQLWNEMNRLGKRVLMNDTDSIVYIYDPEADYNIPEGGLLGEWEVEDNDRDNGGIREFVGLGPKTYAYKCDNGKTFVKTKGISLKLSTDPIVNFETMKNLALGKLLEKKEEALTEEEKKIMKIKKIMVPQKNFVWTIEGGMRNWYMEKELKIEENNMKGKLDKDGFLYPFGFNK